jgi:hypothetical protein
VLPSVKWEKGEERNFKRLVYHLTKPRVFWFFVFKWLKWLMPAILATQEEAIRRIVFMPAWTNSWQDLISNKTITRKDWWSG